VHAWASKKFYANRADQCLNLQGNDGFAATMGQERGMPMVVCSRVVSLAYCTSSDHLSAGSVMLLHALARVAGCFVVLAL
jgi:hypothetical protein